MSRQYSNAIRRKVVVVGDGACGKTTLLNVFALGQFPALYSPTIFETYFAECPVEAKMVELALWDTAGQEIYHRLRPLAYSHAHAILIVFSISSLNSLDSVRQRWHKEVNERCGRIPVVLVGLKKDLRDDPLEREEMRKRCKRFITFKEGDAVGSLIGARKYVECSALTGEGVDEVFETAARQSLLASNSRRDGDCVIL